MCQCLLLQPVVIVHLYILPADLLLMLLLVMLNTAGAQAGMCGRLNSGRNRKRRGANGVQAG